MTMTAAWFVTSWLRVRRISVLSRVLSVEAVLLSSSIGVLPSSVCVTVTCRRRFFERCMLCLLRRAVQVLGRLCRKWLVLVVCVVVLTLVLSVFLWLRVTPLCVAALKTMGLRGINVTVLCS